jgi:hypothetical protein
VFYSDFAHQEIAITKRNGTRVVLWRTSASNNATAATVINYANATTIATRYFPVPDGPVRLAVQTENLRYNFGFAAEGQNITYVGSVDAAQAWTNPYG